MRGGSSHPLEFVPGGLDLIHIPPVAHFCLNKVSIPNKLNLRELMSLCCCRVIGMPRERLNQPPSSTSREEPVV